MILIAGTHVLGLSCLKMWNLIFCLDPSGTPCLARNMDIDIALAETSKQANGKKVN